MNGVHDMGGQHGHGPVVQEPAEPVFHEPWEGRVYGLMTLCRARGLFNLDEMRRAIELIPPARYLGSSYYERWLQTLEALLAEKGVDREAPPPPAQPRDRQLTSLQHRYSPGDQVRVRNRNPRGHTRVPRYVRGQPATVEKVHGPFRLPDTNAYGGSNDWQYVYTVVLQAAKLWGEEGRPGDTVSVDLWESYLEPALPSAGAQR